MDRERLAAIVDSMKQTATMFVECYAAMNAPNVSGEMVTSICGALGDISIDEAMDALDRLQRETGQPARS